MSDFKFICRECGPRDEPCFHWERNELHKELRFLHSAVLEIIHLLRAEFFYPKSLEIRGENMSTPAGGTSVFQEVPTPTGTAFPAGTSFVWSVDDTADISLTPSSDGTQVTAVCVASPTGTSYNLTCTSSFTPPGASAPVSGTLNVPIVPATPPTPTGIQINQVS